MKNINTWTFDYLGITLTIYERDGVDYVSSNIVAIIHPQDLEQKLIYDISVYPFREILRKLSDSADIFDEVLNAYIAGKTKNVEETMLSSYAKMKKELFDIDP